MILFLDTVSSLPEFSIIEDNNIIFSREILSNKEEKMSDLLIPAYLELEKKFNLNSKLQLLLINTGPGSYTALRVGIAFFSGLSISKKINLIGVPCVDLFKYIIPSDELINSSILISSSNNQNFIHFFDDKNKNFKIKKIENNIPLEKQNINLSLTNKIYTNENLLENQKEYFFNYEIKVLTFSELVNINIIKIKKLKKSRIIEPIYLSNNKILD